MKEIIFRVGAFTGLDWLLHLVRPEARMAESIARRGWPGCTVTIVMPSKRAWRVEDGKATEVPPPALPI